MHLSFLTPVGALFILAAALPLAALWLNERRARVVRSALRVDAPPLRGRLATAVALACVPLLLGLALAQPVLRTTKTVRARTDAQVFYVVDTSVSMAAAAGPHGTTRVRRAIAEARQIHLRLDDVPSGLANMTDRVLPTVFPTMDPQEFEAGLEGTIGIDAPPPKGLSDKATTFAALDTFEGTNFFDPGIRHRLVIFFTDGETVPYFPADLHQALQGPPPTRLVVVHVWRRKERIYTGQKADSVYRPDPRSGRAVASLAAATGGRAYGEGDVDGAVRGARTLLGKGKLARMGTGPKAIALADWLLLLAFVPLAALLWRRNVVR